jgi:hypothetical protein
MDLKLKGLSALVTGASKGLGYATALGLARERARLAASYLTGVMLSVDGGMYKGIF